MERHQIKIDYLFDHPDCIDVCASWAFGQWGSQTGGTLSRAQERFAAARNKDALPLTLLAICDGKPAGMVSLWEEDLPRRQDLSPWLASLFVHPFYRGRGFAGLLVERLEAEAIRMGHSTLYLVTEREIDIYKRLGWSVFEPTRTELGDANVMMRNIPSDAT